MEDSDQTDSEFLHKEPCPKCGSRDNLARYSDGHAFCFGCSYYEPAEGDTSYEPRESKMPSDLIEPGDYITIKSRGIKEETCRLFGYTCRKIDGKGVHVAAYRDADGKICAQHIRFPGKDFAWKGDAKSAQLFGQHLWRDGGKMVVVTEGELDAMSVSQIQNNKWPVVSIHCGAAQPEHTKKIEKHIAKFVDWLEQFETVIFMFDMDEQGQASAKSAAAMLSPGKAKIAQLPLHDANEMLLARRNQELLDAMWGAKTYRPDGIVSIADIREEAMRPVEMGRPWCFPTLTDATYGRRDGEVYGFGAGTGVGKTDLFTQQIAYDIEVLNIDVGLIYLEQPVTETAKRVAGKIAGRRFHIPGEEWTAEELGETIDRIDGKVYMYDHFGETDWDVVKRRIRYMAVTLGIKHIYLDHLTAMAEAGQDERGSIEAIMKEMAGLAQQLKIVIHFISHLSTPEGKPHEEGGRVMIKHFKGSRAIGFWSFFMFGLERDQQAEDEKLRTITTFRVLKDRYTGNATGLTIFLKYDQSTGKLEELVENPFDEPESIPFDDDEVPF